MPASRVHAAFLRGVYPTNASMAALRACFEAAGFTDVRTVLGSGNVVFSAAGSEAAIARRAEAAMAKQLGRSFATLVRRHDELAAMIENDPFAGLRVPSGAKRVVTFLRTPPRGRLKLPVSRDGACIAAVADRVAFSHYLPSPRGPVFMQLIADTLGDAVTTRTWDTLRKIVAAGAPVTARSARPAAASAAPPPTRRRPR